MFSRTLNRTPNSTRSRAYKRTGRLWRGVGRLRSCAGFTLTELIIIIIIVGILAAIVSMKSGWLTSGTNLRMALDQVAGDLRFLQARTMGTMDNTTGGTYTNTASFPAGGTTYYLGGQVKSLPYGVTLSIGGTQTVTYNSLGEYNTTTDSVLTLNSKGSTGTIKIYATSGDVEAY